MVLKRFTLSGNRVTVKSIALSRPSFASRAISATGRRKEEREREERRERKTERDI